RGYVAGLRLDDRQRGEGAAALHEVPDAVRQIVHRLHDLVVVDHLRGALEKAAVQVEYIARISLAARRAAQQQGYLAISHGLLGEIVEHNERGAAGIAE